MRTNDQADAKAREGSKKNAAGARKRLTRPLARGLLMSMVGFDKATGSAGLTRNATVLNPATLED